MARREEFLEGKPHYPSSTCFSTMVYNAESEQMFVQFGSGHGGIISGLPTDVAEAWHRSGSKGKFYWRNVRGQYPFSSE